MLHSTISSPGLSHGFSKRDCLLYNNRIDRMRGNEYPMLRGKTYLDHAGTTLPAKSLITAFSEQMQTHLLGNPHSSSSSEPSISHRIVEETRLQVLQLFKANPDHFDLVFVANATAGIKLVVEAFNGCPEGYEYYYHRDSHTSLVGPRELACKSHCFLSDDEVEEWMKSGGSHTPPLEKVENGLRLFAYPAQSNMNGRRLPLSWCSSFRSSSDNPQTFTLLDVAALASTTLLDLSDHINAPDFTVLSFYKIFGFPNLGGLIVRKSAGHVFDHRRYFGGGTTEMTTCSGQPWVERKKSSLHERLEDGTGATHSIVALNCAIGVHARLFGFEEASVHARWLAHCLYEKLVSMKHANGRLVCRIYKDPTSTYTDAKTQGPTVAFNICKSDGTWVSSSKVGAMAEKWNLLVRTGSMCNPAGMAHALAVTHEDIRTAYDSGFRCGQADDVRNGVPMGIVRVSFGAMSVLKDVEAFLMFVEECFVESKKDSVFGSEDKFRNSEQSAMPSPSIGKLSALKSRRKRWWSKILRMCLPLRE
ncbi:PLP-dependent transferase [Delitschia confertaspora ATCC 74209]|uniref:PLP-dependent transferase n=1 Tax=Delitschia confertaspora ATCC 74209 TaxID=1513339 RepID=A0A9P4JG74_9PLEO|nr:PLP-dependent transferase [Delitschia confertaspora ATCC 74209]